MTWLHVGTSWDTVHVIVKVYVAVYSQSRGLRVRAQGESVAPSW